MTTATHPLTGQLTATSMPGLQGTFGPGFPPPIGAEQIFGLVPPITQIPYPTPAVPNPSQPYQVPATASYSVPAFGTMPWQQAMTPFAFSPMVQQVAAQIAPMAQQMLLPYVIGASWQQVLQHLPQVVAQFAAHPGPQWQQYLPPMAGAGIFGQFSRPYSYLS